MMERLAGMVLVAGVSVATCPAWAVTTTIAGSPSVTVEVPEGFTASDTDRGVDIKTPDDEFIVWFETDKPSEQSALIDEHDTYWKDQNVRLGESTRKSEEADGHKIVVTS